MFRKDIIKNNWTGLFQVNLKYICIAELLFFSYLRDDISFRNLCWRGTNYYLSNLFWLHRCSTGRELAHDAGLIFHHQQFLDDYIFGLFLFSNYNEWSATNVALKEWWNSTNLQERWSDYRHACRKPYPEMAYRALGGWGRYHTFNFQRSDERIERFWNFQIFQNHFEIPS